MAAAFISSAAKSGVGMQKLWKELTKSALRSLARAVAAQTSDTATAETRISSGPIPHRLHYLARRVVEIVGGNDIEAGFLNDLLAERDVGSFEPHHQRHAQAYFLDRGNNAFGDHVAAHDAAENIDQDAFHVWIGRDDLKGGRYLVLARAAADVEKVRRCLAVELDDVHGGHGQAGAVHHAADAAVERHVVQIIARGLDFLGVLLGRIAQCSDVRMTIKRVVVEAHFSIETEELAVLGDNQRIDFEETHVFGEKGVIELRQRNFRLLADLAAQAERPRHGVAMMGHKARRRVDRERKNFLRIGAGDFLDLHPAFSRGDERDARRRAIDQRREIIFALDIRAFLDIEAMHFLAVRAGLMRHQRRSKQPLRFALHLIDRFDHFDAAGLAATAGVDLRLDHPDRTAEILRRLDGFIDAHRRNAARHRDAEFTQHRLRLVFVDVHDSCWLSEAATVASAITNSSIAKIWSDLLAGLDQAPHRLHGFLEHPALAAVELDFDHTLNSLTADNDRHADIKIVDAVLAIEPGGRRQHAFLVAQITFRHRNRRTCRCVEGRASLEQADDLTTAVARALDNRVEPRRRRPTHLDEIGQRNPGHRRIPSQRHHAVTVAAEHESGDIFNRDVEFVGEKVAKARRVEHAGHADHHLLRQAATLLQRPHHGVERVGDADDESGRRIFRDAGADLLHHLQVDVEEVVAAHSRLARHAGGDDADRGTLDRLVRIGAGKPGIEAFNRRGFDQIERFALRNTLGNVKKNDID